MLSFLRRSLQRAPQGATAVYAATFAFCTYTCMYAFRKAFGAGSYELAPLWGLDYKTVLVISQVLGYTLSKFLGIKYVSAAGPGVRARAILVLIGIAWLALLGFAATPAPFNAAFFFMNGLPLGMIWGLVFSYLEGRRTTEFLGAGLSVSFIFASGFVKDIGGWLMRVHGVSELWMPFVTGAVFTLPLVVCVVLLHQLPPPSPEDVAQRAVRPPMSGRDRIRLLRQAAVGLSLLVVIYVLLSVVRQFRDDFGNEVWAGLGFTTTPDKFSQTETPISLIILGVMGLLMFVRRNALALDLNHLVIAGGFVLLGAATYLHQVGAVDAVTYMLLNGLGLFLGYVPFNAILFDRLIATFRYHGNVGFLIYIADAFGYLGAVGVLLYRNLGAGTAAWLPFFQQTSYIAAVVGVVFTGLAWVYFRRRVTRALPPETPQPI